MTDEDARLRRLLASAAKAPEDDAFLAQVQQRIQRARRTRRIVGASVAVVLAAALVLMTPLLLDIAQHLAGAIALGSHGAAAIMLSPIGALLALIAGIALAAARRR
jgi:hypothetical protein